MSIQKIGFVSLWAKDVNATAHFYRDLLGLRLLAIHGGPFRFDVDGTNLVIRRGQPGPLEDNSLEPSPVVTFLVDELSSTLQRLQAAHVELPFGMDEEETARRVRLYDPGGNLIELVQYKKPNP